MWTRQNSRHKTKDGTEPWPEGEANFRLILKAPQMLAALEAIRHRAEYGLETTNIFMDWENWDAVKEITLTAIAAVKGDENDEKELV